MSVALYKVKCNKKNKEPHIFLKCGTLKKVLMSDKFEFSLYVFVEQYINQYHNFPFQKISSIKSMKINSILLPSYLDYFSQLNYISSGSYHDYSVGAMS